MIRDWMIRMDEHELSNDRINGLGPNVAHLDGETKKVQFEKVRDILSRRGGRMSLRPEGP